MDAAGIAGNGSEERTGARVLALLAAPLNAVILRRLSQGPRRFSELQAETGGPLQATLRTHLGQLREIGVVTRCGLGLFPRIREYELAGLRGRELRFVATTLENWLSECPREPLPPESEAARAAVEALADGWSSTVLHALAAGPATVEELSETIERLDRSSIERRLAVLRDAGLVESRAGVDGGALHAVNEWMRQGVAPLAAAIRWERHHLPNDTASIAPLDAEAGLMLSLLLLRLPPELSGSCRLGVEFGAGPERRVAGATVVLERGRVVSSSPRLQSDAAAWASGPPAAWLRSTIEADPDRLALGGDERLVRAVLDGMNRALFGPTRHTPPP